MDSYTPLLEKTRIPQPSLQRLAVIAIFEKFRSGLQSSAGGDAVSSCLRSSSRAVVDQSTRELCRLVRDSKLDCSTGLLELQSALEESSDTQLVGVFIKAIGLLTRLGFQENPSSFRFHASEFHPFVKILSRGIEVQEELVKQVTIFIIKCKHLGMDAVCKFLGPFIKYSIIQLPALSSSSAFARNLVSTMAAFCCSSPQEAIPIIKLLMGCLKYFSCKNAEEVTNVSYAVESLVDAYLVVLRHLVGMGLLVQEAQLCGIGLVEAILVQHRDFLRSSGGTEKILDISRHLLIVHKELGLHYVDEYSSVILALLPVLIQAELEHEQYSLLKLLLFLLMWKNEAEYRSGSTNELEEELLFIFPVLALVSSSSRSIKQTALDLLSILGKLTASLLSVPKKNQVVEVKEASTSTAGHIIFRFLKNLWFEDQLSSLGSLYISFSYDKDFVTEELCKLKTWTSSVKQYYEGIVEKQKSTATISLSEIIFLSETSMVLCALATIFLLHQMGSPGVELLSIANSMEPKVGVPLFLTVLFCNHMLSKKVEDSGFHNMGLRLLGMLPSLASHPGMIPLILQILLPMLRNDVDPVIKATTIRLMCKTWEANDRVFGSLQEVLHPNALQRFASEKGVCVSIAVSIQDVCRRNPDRGVDIILSVAACIENHDPLVHSLGCQSLAHLCEADVIDFYTAWDVIAKHVQKHLGDAIAAHGLSLLLRWGAMDAEAYPEAASSVLNILWDVATCREIRQSFLWRRAQEAAVTALSQYDVAQVQRSIQDFSTRNMQLLTSQADFVSFKALEEFEVRIISHEHITRRRFVKQKRVSANKIVKLLDIVPEAIFNSGVSGKSLCLKEIEDFDKLIGCTGAGQKIKELPGAALLCFPTHKDVKNQTQSKGSLQMHAKYEDAAVEIFTSLQLSRNVFLTLFSLQSWKPFMQRWMRSCIMTLEAKSQPAVLDKTLKAADDILKALTKFAEAAIPRSAENVALAFGAFVLILPASAHAVKSKVSKFLLNWLFQYEHEFRQWSAAISLGLISSCLHVTDHKQKHENINALLQVISISKSTFVKGACAIALGFSCHDLLTRFDPEANTQLEKETYKTQEMDLLRKILRTLVQMISQITGSSASIMENLAAYFPLGPENSISTEASEFLMDDIDDLEDTWAIAGPIIGLGNCLGAIYRAGSRDAIVYLKSLIISWIPTSLRETWVQKFSLGACIALPTVIAFCLKVELVDDSDLDNLLSRFKELISELLSVKQPDTFHHSLLMAACAGAGSLLSIVLDSGFHSLEVEHVKEFLMLFRRTYSGQYPPFIHLGGMLGIVNAMGAGAATLIQQSSSSSLRTPFDPKESSYISGPLLSNHVLEAELTSSVQDVFLLAQNPDDPLLQQYAAWAVLFLRHTVFYREHADMESAAQIDSGNPRPPHQGFAEDSLVMKLSAWLMHIKYPELGSRINISTVAFILRCLSHAPRLPPFDWGIVIKRFMKYNVQVGEIPSQSSSPSKRNLREECFLFSLSHANQFDSLLGFLDELSSLARFKTLEVNMQSLVLLHLADLFKIFSNSRVVKLFEDMADFLHWLVSSDQYDEAQKISLRVTFWKGLQTCLNEYALEKQEYAYNLEYCMEILFTMLPWFHPHTNELACQKNANLEWTESITCLARARKSWVSDLLLISDTAFTEYSKNPSVLKKIKAKAALVRNGSIPLLELAKMRSYMLNMNSEDVWIILVEVVVTLQHTDESIRRQWLVDTSEVLCVTSYPSTALRFLGLLCGSWCKYMPFLAADKAYVLYDLPATLSSLLLCPGWEMVAEPVALYIWKSAERIHDWASHIERDDYVPDSQPIDGSENNMAVFLFQLMHRTCVSVKEYLPVDKQLRLANMVAT